MSRDEYFSGGNLGTAELPWAKSGIMFPAPYFLQRKFLQRKYLLNPVRWFRIINLNTSGGHGYGPEGDHARKEIAKRLR